MAEKLEIAYKNPVDIGIEESVLGAIILESESLNEVVDFLKIDHFYKFEHQKIYRIILDMHFKSEQIDLLTVVNKLRDRKKLDEVGGAAYITILTTKVNLSLNIETHARLLQELYFKREMLKHSTKNIKEINEGADIFEVMEESAKFNFNIESELHTNQVTTILETSKEIYKQVVVASEKKTPITGLQTGLRAIDEPMAGMQPDYIVLAGRPGMGKTTLALNIARNMAVDFNIPVALFSLEMSKQSLTRNLHCCHSMIDKDKMKRGTLTEDDWKRWNHSMQSLISAPIYIDDSPGLNVLEIRSKARKLVQLHGVKAIFIDYLQLIQVISGKKQNNNQNREREVSFISGQLLQMKKELGIPIIALSQLSRNVEQRGGDKRPIPSDLRDSGSLEQDADIILFTYRPIYYGITQDSEGNEVSKDYTELIYSKFRDGSVGSCPLSFNGAFGKFTDYTNYFGEPKSYQDPPDDGRSTVDWSKSKLNQSNNNFYEKNNDDDQAPF